MQSCLVGGWDAKDFMMDLDGILLEIFKRINLSA